MKYEKRLYRKNIVKLSKFTKLVLKESNTKNLKNRVNLLEELSYKYIFEINLK